MSEQSLSKTPPLSKATILLFDDSPAHLSLYSRVVTRAGFRALTALAAGSSVPLPYGEAVDLTLLDYTLGGGIKAETVAKEVLQAFPSKPIVVLSDRAWMPDEIRPYAARFVRKGEPELMLEVLNELTRPQHS